MAAKLKADIITIIDQKIVTNGNIRAKDTNAILKDILDCTELNDNSSKVAIFDISGMNLTDNRGGILNYSARGIESSFANVSLRLHIKENSAGIFEFKHEKPELFAVFKSILKQNAERRLNFLVNLIRDQKPFIIANLNFNVTEQHIIIQLEPFLDSVIYNGDTLFTSIALHCPKGL